LRAGHNQRIKEAIDSTMAKKKAAKAAIPSRAAPGPASKTKMKTTSSMIPAPFAKSAENLSPFLEYLDKTRIYLGHIDTHPAAFKRQIFLFPALINVAIVLLLLWRIYYIVPVYLGYMYSMNGHQNDYNVDVANSSWQTLATLMFARAASFGLDWALYAFVFPWPRNFMMGPVGSPFAWRQHVPFQDKEVVVRVSRDWAKDVGTASDAAGQDSVFQARVIPAMTSKLLFDKTGYVLIGPDWELDYNAMIAAHDLVSTGDVPLEDFRKFVLVYWEDCGGWVTWDVWKLDEKGGQGDAGRQKIVAFKERLDQLGKERLFFRWIELVQFESTQPGGFTPERQASAMRQAKELFEKEGVDFDAFWKSVGGMEQMPGMEATL
jgi:hypothetical protein